MADLVGDHVGLGEIAGRPEAVFQVLVKAQVNLDPVILGAIEGPHGCLGEAAGGLHRAGEEGELRAGLPLLEFYGRNRYYVAKS